MNSLVAIIDEILTLYHGKQPLFDEAHERLQALDAAYRKARVAAGLPALDYRNDDSAFLPGCRCPFFTDNRSGKAVLSLKADPDWESAILDQQEEALTADPSKAIESEDGYVAYGKIRQLLPDRFPTHESLVKYLKEHPKIRRRHRSSQRPEVHSADLLNSLETSTVDPLDKPAWMVDAVVKGIESSKAEIDRKRQGK